MINSAHAAAVLVTAFGFAVAMPIAGSTATASYPEMAPIAQYLIADRQAEIGLARSAAPASISGHATVLVLTPQGYETAATGTNGFTCLVERSWENAFDNAEFWNEKMRAPVCYNASASRSVLPYTVFRAKLILAHGGKAKLLQRLRAAIAEKKLPRLEASSMAYMMSKDQYLNDGAKAWYPHVMVYAPQTASARGGESWGANRAGSPVVLDTSDRIMPEPWTLFFIPVGTWSDNSAAPTS
jgi:hypothetical protein